MKYSLKRIEENICGIWVNQKYDLLLGLQPHNTFSFADNKGEGIHGEYFIVQPTEGHFPTLRLVDTEGMSHDYVINDLLAFESLTISREGEIIDLKNVSPDEYEDNPE